MATLPARPRACAAPSSGLPRPAGVARRRRVAIGRPAAHRARARGPLRLQPDHRPARARRARPRGPDRADPRPRDVRHPAVDPPRHGRLAQLRRGDDRPGPPARDAPRRLAQRDGRVDGGGRPGDRARRADALRRAAPAGRRRAAPARAGPPAGRPVPGSAERRSRGRLAVRAPGDALRHARAPTAARPSCRSACPPARPACSARSPHRLALLVEGVAYTRTGVPVEYARSYVRGDRMRYHVDREIARSSWLAEVDRQASGQATRE